MFFQGRTIVEEDSVQDAVDGARGQFPRVDDVFEALKWRLARRPDSGTQIDSRGTYLLKTADICVDGAPVLTGMYTFDDDQVTLLAIRIVEPSNGD